MEKRNVLVIGATGAMGQYLTPALAEMGFRTDALAIDLPGYSHPNIRNIKGNAADWKFMTALLKENRYDGIVDFMKYNTAKLTTWLPMFLENTGHYIYLSSYRVYGNEELPVRETSPRLIDCCQDPLLVNSDDYCIYKARGENVLRGTNRKNWTIIRPAITYSLMRYQLATMEAPMTVARAFAGKPVVIPEQVRHKYTTMSWAGDVAEMIAKLLFNPQAYGEAFTVATAEHHTWEEIAGYYHDICKMDVVWVDKEIYNTIPGYTDIYSRWQLEYDRLFDRIMDNSKVLAVTGMQQQKMKKLYDGLEYEIGRCPRDTDFGIAGWVADLWDKMDEIAKGIIK